LDQNLLFDWLAGFVAKGCKRERGILPSDCSTLTQLHMPPAALKIMVAIGCSLLV